MPTPLRYQQAEIYNHLANQYVAGVVTPRVRARIETLALTIPALADAIAYWSDAFVELQMPINETQKKLQQIKQVNFDRVWHHVNHHIQPTQPVKPSLTIWQRLQNNLMLGKFVASGGALVAMLLLSFLWLLPPQTAPMANASYLAAMNKHGDKESSVQFVISAYAKQNDSPSRLSIQWVKGESNSSHVALHLWAEDKVSGEYVYIGLKKTDNHSVALTKPMWTAISNSRRLLMTQNRQIPNNQTIVFSGLCLQLTQWKS